MLENKFIKQVDTEAKAYTFLARNLDIITEEQKEYIFKKYNIHFTPHFCMLILNRLLVQRDNKNYHTIVIKLIKKIKPKPNYYLYKMLFYIDNNLIDNNIFNTYIKPLFYNEDFWLRRKYGSPNYFAKYIDKFTDEEIKNFIEDNKKYYKRIMFDDEYTGYDISYIPKEIANSYEFLWKLEEY